MKRISSVVFLLFFLMTLASADAYDTSKGVVLRLLCILYVMTPGVVFAMMVISVINLLLHSENPEKRDDAKNMFKNALIGGVIVIALVQVAKVVDIDVNKDICMGTGGGTTPITPPDPKYQQYLVSPPTGMVFYYYATITGLPILIPVLNKKWLKKP
jgi:hypothetical protein